MKGILVILTLLFSLNSFGQMLMDWYYSSCSEKSYPELIQHRIVSQERIEDTLRLSVAVVLNCCINPELKVSKSNDSLFFWVNNKSDIMCMCKCCFELNLEFSGITDDSIKIIYAKEELDLSSEGFNYEFVSTQLFESPYKYGFPPPAELKTYENYEGEINQLSEDGEKIGLWRREGESHNYLFYTSPTHNPLPKWYASYTKEGELVDICGYDVFGESSNIEARTYYNLFGIEP